MGSRSTNVYLIFPDGFRKHIATLQGGITGGDAGGQNLNYTVWMMNNADMLRKVWREHPGTRIEVIDSGGA